MSGWDMSRRRQRASKGGEAAKATNRFPLRRVETDNYHEAGEQSALSLTLLECGHLLLHASDMIGVRYPARRRCRKCAEGLPRDVPA